ncbi:MAG: response regulator [Clostridium sp.]|nr:response regulator [Clostridium sp.]
MERLGRIILLVVLVSVTTLTSVARQFYFRNYDIKNGLSQNTVHAILQDRQGYIWIGTKDGLNRFDGRKFRRVNVDGDDSNCSFISCIYEDSDGKIWVGTHYGPCVYDPETESMSWFDIATENGERIKKTCDSFCEDPDGNLIISVEDSGIFSYDRRSGHLSRILRTRDYAMPNVNQILYSAGGRVYLGTFGSGVYYTDDNFATVHALGDQSGRPWFPTSVVNAICQKGDQIYIATDNRGLYAVDGRTGQVSQVFLSDENGQIPIIRDLMPFGQSELWIASESGVYIYDIAAGALTHHLTHDYFDRYSLSDNAVYCLMADRDGGLWIGSYFGGLDYLSSQPMQFDKYSRLQTPGSIEAERVRELCCDGSGKIYVGSEDSGLSCFDPATERFTRVDGIDEKNIHGLCIDGRDLWIGTFAEGLRIKNLDTGKIRRYYVGDGTDPRGLTSNFVFTILRTIHGDIYIGTIAGLERYDRATDTFTNVEEVGGFVYDLYEDSEGNIWAANYSHGLDLLRPGDKNWIRFSTIEGDTTSIPSNKVYSVQQDRQGNIWVMTQNGASVFDAASRRFDRTYAGVNRIPGVVYRMVEDDNGRYWFTSNHGLYCIDPETGAIRNFTTDDGLPTNQFNFNSSLRSAADGRIYFGSIDGLVAFNPLRYVSSAQTMSTPVVSELYVNGRLVKPGEEGSPLTRSVSLTDRLELSPDQNSLSFRLANLNFNNSGSQEIRYRLLGVDKDWRTASQDNSLLSYANLNYGTYHLQVALCNSSDGTFGPVFDMEIRIATPFYLSWWATLIYLLIAATIVTFSVIYWRSYTRLQNQRYLEHYTREKEREAYESKIRFFTNVAHEIRTPLSLIKAPLDCVFSSPSLQRDPEARENLDVINMNVDRLLLLANQLLDFRKMESGKFQIAKRRTDIKQLILSLVPRFRPTIERSGKRLEITMPEHPVTAVVDPEAITKIISNLFTNAIKYGSTYIRLNLETDDTAFILRMSNDGPVVAPDKREEIFSLFSRLESGEPGTGIGLAYSRSLAHLHNGTLVMTDAPDENVMELRVPLGQDADTADDPASDPAAGSGSDETDLDQIARQPDGNPVSVLLVEDNAEMLSFISKKLTARNYRVLTATNGLEALEVLGNQYVDIVVSDVMMPGMDGTQLLEHIKNNINYSHIPVILLTAKTRMEDKLEGLGAGADAYIEKPFTMEYLAATISSLLRNRERMRRRLEEMPLSKNNASGLTRVDEDFLRRINDIIQQNFSNPDFSMEDVISSLGLSRTTFYRKIKGMLDLSPNDYIKIQRLKRAAQLFREGHTGVSEVCYMVGFSSPGYFTKCFQRQFGISPKDYIAGKGKNSPPGG